MGRRGDRLYMRLVRRTKRNVGYAEMRQGRVRGAQGARRVTLHGEGAQ